MNGLLMLCFRKYFGLDPPMSYFKSNSFSIPFLDSSRTYILFLWYKLLKDLLKFLNILISVFSQEVLCLYRSLLMCLSVMISCFPDELSCMNESKHCYDTSASCKLYLNFSHFTLFSLKKLVMFSISSSSRSAFMNFQMLSKYFLEFICHGSSLSSISQW